MSSNRIQLLNKHNQVALQSTATIPNIAIAVEERRYLRKPDILDEIFIRKSSNEMLYKLEIYDARYVEFKQLLFLTYLYLF